MPSFIDPTALTVAYRAKVQRTNVVMLEILDKKVPGDTFISSVV